VLSSADADLIGEAPDDGGVLAGLGLEGLGAGVAVGLEGAQPALDVAQARLAEQLERLLLVGRLARGAQLLAQPVGGRQRPPPLLFGLLQRLLVALDHPLERLADEFNKNHSSITIATNTSHNWLLRNVCRCCCLMSTTVGPNKASFQVYSKY